MSPPVGRPEGNVVCGAGACAGERARACVFGLPATDVPSPPTPCRAQGREAHVVAARAGADARRTPFGT